MKRFIAITLSVIVALLIPFSAFAADETGSLGITFKTEDGTVSGVHFDTYKIADWSTNGKFTLTGSFKDYAVSLDNLDDTDALMALATTLAAYAARDGIEPDAEGETADHGYLKFSDLPIGLYLVTGKTFTQDNKIYTPQPFIVSIPYDGVYDVTAEAKYDFKEIPDGEDPTFDIEVLKVWHDDSKAEARPADIVVQLLKDGEVYDEVILNESNGWKYEWKDMPIEFTWQITEKDVPDGYTVSTILDQTLFTVINTFVMPTNPEDPTGPSEPFNPDNPNNPTNPSTPPDSNLPQTGQLWWPVPVLIAAGVMLFVVGVIFRKRSESADA